MAATREQVAVALAAKLDTTAIPSLKRFSRVLNSPENTPAMEQPALYLYQVGDPYDNEKGRAPIRRLHFNAEIYTNRGSLPTAIPDTEMNAVLDAIDLALAPDPVSWFQDLNGLVSHVWVEGQIGRFPANDGAQSIAVVPIEVMLKSEGAFQAPYIFDSGTLWATPISANQKIAQSNTTPIRIGNLRGIVLECENKIDPASVGAFRHPARAWISASRIKGRAEIGVFDGRLLNQVLFGAQVSAGARLISKDQAGVVPAAVTYTITPTPPGSGTWQDDLGVFLADDGTALTLASGTPASGEYSVASGTYTFNAAQAGENVKISYVYSIAGGSTVTIPNGPGSEAAYFRLDLSTGYGDSAVTVRLNRVAVDRFSMPTSLERFAIGGLEFIAIADSSNEVGRFSGA